MCRLRPLFSVLALAAFASWPCLAAHPSRSKLAPCKVPRDDKQVDALCGTYSVWENREAKAGRRISLKIVVLPSRSPDPLPGPVLDLSGGPGEADTGGAGEGLGSTEASERRCAITRRHPSSRETDTMSRELSVVQERPRAALTRSATVSPGDF